MSRKKTALQIGQLPLPTALSFDLRNPHFQQFIALVVALLGALLTACLLGVVRSEPTDAIKEFLQTRLGVGAFTLTLGVLLAGLLSLRALVHHRFEIAWRRVVGAEAMFFALLALLHVPYANPRAVAERGEGGGMVGWAIWSGLAAAIGNVPAFALLLLFGALGAIWLLELDLLSVAGWIAARLPTFSQPASATTAPEVNVSPSPLKRERRKSAPKEKPSESLIPRVADAKNSRAKRLRGDKRLPPLDIFRARSKIEIDNVLMNERALIIEETLNSFGIPARVVDKQQGPTVTQFALEPGYIERKLPDGETKKIKIKVSRIASLSNDLALALAASPIRIEAPVPGKPYVGIEVPNEKNSMVAIRSVLEADTYRKFDKPLKFALGQDVAGTPIFADLAAMPHLLIAGATGSGKSVCINAIIASLLVNNTPDDLRMLMIDPKMVELVTYNGIPHLLHPVVTDLDKAAGALHWAMREMDKRYRAFQESGARNLDAFNKKASDDEKLPYVVVVIDELADLMMQAPEEIEKTICRLAQMARATGIHLILATQRPSVDVVTGLIKANFPARISFAVTTQTDSRVILDTGGAEKLLGRGDMLYMAPDSPKLLRLQGCWVSDDELRKLVNHWRDVAVEAQLAAEPIELPQVEATSNGNGSKAKEDDLLGEAIRLVQQFDRASTSFLQRRMGIGYNRAARLIDIMEARGIIGPAKEGGLAREVLAKANGTADEMDEDEE